MFSLRSLVASSLLLASSTAAYAQWEVQSIPHKKNPATFQLVARSPLSVPNETIESPHNDISVSLGVTSFVSGYGESSSYIWTYFVPGKEYGPRALAKAYTVESGFHFKETDHVYASDMSGSKEAINTVCNF